MLMSAAHRTSTDVTSLLSFRVLSGHGLLGCCRRTEAARAPKGQAELVDHQPAIRYSAISKEKRITQ
jgi:hypothetical protein